MKKKTPANRTKRSKSKEQPQPRDVQITRENWALGAMQGIIARGEPITALWPENQSEPVETQIARAAWVVADAMIAQSTWVRPAPPAP